MSRCFNASAALHNADQIAKKAPGPVCLIFQSTVRDVRASRKMRCIQLSPPSWRAVGKITASFKARWITAKQAASPKF
jgi:hypothetical protein